MRSSVISPVNKDCPFVLVWRHEAKASRRSLRTEIRQIEQARQWDRQRSDIHPTLVSERLASVKAEITQVVTLADPVPDAEPDRPVPVLPIRMWRVEEPS
jgi:hypothetical protein